MLTIAGALTAVAVALQPGTSVVLGEIERDLTGDGRSEIIRVVGAGPTAETLAVTFTIESGGGTIFQSRLEPLTRTVGIDAGRRITSAEEHQERLREFGRWFFAAEKFQSPAEFAKSLTASTPGKVVEIADAIERDRPWSDQRDGRDVWQEIEKSPVTIFTFSPGGDAIVAIGWSAQAGRFYRLLECC